MIFTCDRIHVIFTQDAKIMLENILNKENILIIKKWNITELANAAYPESHSVSSFMVYAFYGSTFLQLGVYIQALTKGMRAV